jgi:hypothetical protein
VCFGKPEGDCIANALQGEEADEPIEDRPRIVVRDRLLDPRSFETAGDIVKKGRWGEIKGRLNHALEKPPSISLIRMHRAAHCW